MAVFKNKSRPASEKIKKSIQSIFRKNELKITIQCNLKILNYLDVTFNLTDSSYRPFNKTNNEINYIHKQWNHPPPPCETTFKLLYANHKKSFNHRNHKSDTELSNDFWKIKDNKLSTNITWESLGRHQAYNTCRKRCALCLNEKLKTALHRNNNMLNTQTELLNKYALMSYDSKD